MVNDKFVKMKEPRMTILKSYSILLSCSPKMSEKLPTNRCIVMNLKEDFEQQPHAVVRGPYTEVKGSTTTA